MTYDERTFWLQEEVSFSGWRVRSALSDVAFFGVLVVAVTGFWLWGPKISVVLSQSMNPTYTAGDALLVVPWGTPHVGDIVQFTVQLAQGQAETTAPVTHRIIGQDDRGFITKGDNPKSTPDAWRVTPDMIEGYVVFWMPQVWMFRIASGLIGLALLLFLWPKSEDEGMAEADAPALYPIPVQVFPRAIPPAFARPRPQTSVGAPEGRPVTLPPSLLPQGRPVPLPPPEQQLSGVL